MNAFYYTNISKNRVGGCNIWIQSIAFFFDRKDLSRIFFQLNEKEKAGGFKDNKAYRQSRMSLRKSMMPARVKTLSLSNELFGNICKGGRRLDPKIRNYFSELNTPPLPLYSQNLQGSILQRSSLVWNWDYFKMNPFLRELPSEQEGTNGASRNIPSFVVAFEEK